MLRGFTNAKLSNNQKLLCHNNLSFYWGGDLPLYFLKNRTSIPIPIVKWGNSSYD